jgi:pimeloyl-ACP methyl ester carboxylesterase
MFRDFSEMPAGAAGVMCAAPTSLRPVDRHGAARGRRHLRVRTRDGLYLAVRDRGPRNAEHNVIFLHGYCLGEAAWARQIAKLRRRYGNRVRAISFDHRGHGHSDPAPIQTCRIEQLVDDLDCVLVELDVQGPVTLVGHSMGAMVALAYLARPQASRPVDVDGLVLVATAAGHLTTRGLGRLLATPGTSTLCILVEHSPEKALKVVAGPVCSFIGRLCGCGRAERATVSALAARALAQTPLSTVIGFLPSLRDYDLSAALASIRARTAIVSGGNDLLTPAEHAFELAAAIPGAAHIHVPWAGHMLPQQVPDVIDEAIRRVMALHRGPACAASPLGGRFTAGGRGVPALSGAGL